MTSEAIVNEKRTRSGSSAKKGAAAKPKTPRKPPGPRLHVLGQRLLKDDKNASLRLARRVFRAANTGDLDVAITFVHDIEMRALNRAWRKKDRPTDVLSFSAQEGEPMPGDQHVLGDLVISVDTARRQARELGHPLEVEVAVLVAHGLCHLAGLDHELGRESARVQAACEQALLAAAGVEVGAALIARAS